MIFAEYYHRATDGKTLIPACGSDSISIFDGRWSREHCLQRARQVCLQRGWKGFTLNAGRSVINCREIHSLEPVDD